VRLSVTVSAVLSLLLLSAALFLGGSSAPASVLPDESSPFPTATTPPEPEPAPTEEPALVEDPAPVEGAEQVAWKKAPLIEAAVARVMANFPGEYSVLLHDLVTGLQWAHNPDRLYHPASTIKLPVALYALEQYRAGALGWQDLIEYTPADFESPGGGAFETAPFGGLYPVENLVNRALMYSNNVAVNMLGRHLGWGNIALWTASLGADLTWEDGRPQASALSELGWWLHLHRLAEEDPESAELLLRPLRDVAYDGRIGAGLPEGVPYLHKFGSYDGSFHDGGIVYTERPYILVVLTAGAEIYEADAAIAALSAELYGVMAAPEA
jgi:beta-lactamase class A